MDKYAIRQMLPYRLRSLLRRIYHLFTDFMDWVQGRRDEMTPPKGLMFVGGGDFKETGDLLCQYLKDLCDLRPHERVLDVGCGIGRVAVPLTRYLNGQGSYEGFDIVPEGITWCQSKISSKYPNFRFQIADVYNSKYYPKGRCQPSEYVFPYETASFDLVFLTSVFTHLLPNDLEHYLQEIARVLKPNGRCLISYFLFNDSSLQGVDAGNSAIAFKHNHGTYRVMSNHEPEAAVGYDEPFILSLYAKYGLDVQRTCYGSWSNPAKHTPAANHSASAPVTAYQDLIIANRTSRPL